MLAASIVALSIRSCSTSHLPFWLGSAFFSTPSIRFCRSSTTFLSLAVSVVDSWSFFSASRYAFSASSWLLYFKGFSGGLSSSSTSPNPSSGGFGSIPSGGLPSVSLASREVVRVSFASFPSPFNISAVTVVAIVSPSSVSVSGLAFLLFQSACPCGGG